MRKIFCAVVVFAVVLHVASGDARAAEKAEVSKPAVVKAASVVAPEIAKLPAVVKTAPVVAPETAKVSAAKVKVTPVVAPETAKVSAAKVKVTPALAEQKEMSKEDMIARVKEMCQYRPDIVPSIPGLAMKEVGGKKVCEFNGKKLEELDKDTLTKLFGEINRFVSFQNTQRFEQQMKNLKRIDDINKLQKSLRKPYVPSVPKAYKPPPKAYVPPTKPYRAPGK